MQEHWPRLTLLPILLFGATCVGTSKSSNPLSPSIAGPIAGVEISVPTVVSPALNARVDTTTQPIILRVGNAVSTGVRPLKYRFEVATDLGFSGLVFAGDSVPQDPSGNTSLTLPSALAPERRYYWHARAEDGANTGPFGATSAFNVFTPVVFGSPTLLSPLSDADTGTLQPRFVLANATHSGPVEAVYYLIEVSTSSSFGSVSVAWQFPEGSTQSELTAPTSLSAGQYFWRARAFGGGYTGPHSGVASFRTSGSGDGDPGEPCGPPYPTTPLGILECRRSQYGATMTPADHVAFLSGSAKDLTEAGVSGGPFGILVKTFGRHCNGYSCDIICAGSGSSQQQWDVLIDEQFVTWGVPIPNPTVRVCEIQ